MFFAVIFVAEAPIKLYAMYPVAYFSDRWNCFDFFCVATTLIGYMAGTGAVRPCCACCVWRASSGLVRKLKGLLMLFNTLIVSLPGLINIGALLFLLCFVYAVLGMNLFGKVKFGENLNEDANFTNFGNSILILLRMVTGEAWNAIMYDCMVTEECDASMDCARGECCGSRGAPVYFITFVIFGSFITLNLLIAVVLDNFSNSKKEEGVQVTDDDIKDFAEAWSKIDPRATGFIPEISRLASLLKLARRALGVKGTKTLALGFLRFQKNLNLKVESNYMHYQDVLQAVTARAMGHQHRAAAHPGADGSGGWQGAQTAHGGEAPEGPTRGLERGGVDEVFEITHGVVGVDGEELDIAQLYAVQRIQAAFRGRQARRGSARGRRARRAEARAQGRRRRSCSPTSRS